MLGRWSSSEVPDSAQTWVHLLMRVLIQLTDMGSDSNEGLRFTDMGSVPSECPRLIVIIFFLLFRFKRRVEIGLISKCQPLVYVIYTSMTAKTSFVTFGVQNY